MIHWIVYSLLSVREKRQNDKITVRKGGIGRIMSLHKNHF
jgi:hypothetical protein